MDPEEDRSGHLTAVMMMVIIVLAGIAAFLLPIKTPVSCGTEGDHPDALVWVAWILLAAAGPAYASWRLPRSMRGRRLWIGWGMICSLFIVAFGAGLGTVAIDCN